MTNKSHIESAKVTRAQNMYGEHPIGFSSNSDSRRKMDPLLDQLFEYYKKGMKILDGGCGAGYFLERATASGIDKSDLFAVDLSPDNIKRLADQGWNVKVGNLLDLNEIDTNSFDFVYSQGVIHHTPDSKKAFSELARVTKPGGMLYINVYYFWNPYYFFIHRLTYPLRWLYWDLNIRSVAPLFLT